VSRASTIALGSGRRLAYAQYGDAQGRPAFYFHGFPGSRLEAATATETAREAGVRLIAVDRPGYGASDPRPGRALLDWPGDIAQLADRLDLADFSIAGYSGGAPYALACGAKLGRRVRAVAVLCGLGPPETQLDVPGMMWHNRLGLAIGRRAPFVARPVLAIGGPLLARAAPLAIANLRRHSAACDRMALDDPAFRRNLERSFREGFAQGGSGAAGDAAIYGCDWGFKLDQIAVPVHLWHGEDDRVLPVAMGRRLAALLPGCRAEYLEGEGHFSFAFRCLGRVFEAL